jgi:hypothetical protein
VDALRDLMAREIGKLEPRQPPAQPAAITPPRPAAKLDVRPAPKPEMMHTAPKVEARADAKPQPARREVRLDPIARATLDKLMAGEIARVEKPNPGSSSAPARAAPTPVAPPVAARPAAVTVRVTPPPPATPRPAPAPVRAAAVPAPSATPVRAAPVVARAASSAPQAPRGQWSRLAWPTAQPAPKPALATITAASPAPAPVQTAAPSVPEPQPAPVVQAAPVQAEPAPEAPEPEEAKSVTPPVLAALFEARAVPGGKGVFATKAIAKGTRLFGDDDWADEEERKSFSALSLQQFEELKPTLRTVFLRYAYNTSLEQVTGAFRPELVRDPVNFINHSCDPNAGYDGAGNIVALRSIAADEEIRMDYGTFTFSFDHEFTCRCQALWCRGKVTAKDWPDLVRAGLRLPAFMRQETAKALWG